MVQGSSFILPDPLQALLDRLEAVRPAGPNAWQARCPAHDDRSPSLSIRLAEDRILVHCFAGCPLEVVLAAVGLEARDLFLDRRPWRPWTGSWTPRPKVQEGPGPELVERWEALWRAGHVFHPLKARYLEARGLSWEALKPLEAWRLLPPKGDRPPLLVARVEGPRRELLGLHLTALERNGSGRVWKKLAKGSRPKGGAIRLFPLEGEVLAVAEGVETALAVHLLSGLPTWASVSAVNMAAWRPPEGVKRVVLALDHDRAGLEAGRALARRLVARGLEVVEALPPREGQDWLDALREEVGA